MASRRPGNPPPVPQLPPTDWDEEPKRRPRKRAATSLEQVGKLAVGVFLVAVFGAVAVSWLTGTNPRDGLPPPLPSKPTSPPPSSSISANHLVDLGPGDRVVVKVPGKADGVWIATEEAWVSLLKAEQAKDQARIDELVSAGQAAFAKNGDKFDIVKWGAREMRVRAFSGPLKGKVWLIPRECLGNLISK